MGYSVQFKHMGCLKFDMGDIEILRTYSMPGWAWTNLAISSLIMALPLTIDEITDTPATFLKMASVFLIAVAACYGLSRLLGSSTPFSKFLYTASTVNLFASATVAILTYTSLFVFEWIMDNAALSNMVASVLPFYIFVLFGFSVDGAANLPEKKGAWVGAAGITILYVLYYFFA